MLRLALAFEFRALSRSWIGLLGVFAFIGVGSLTIIAGHHHVTQWQAALVTANEAQLESVTEARGYLERGEPGPADRSWVDMSQPLWQDWYAGTRVSRKPTPLAGIAIGSVDPAPVVFRVNRFANPLSASGYRIENPELAVGMVDLIFVLSLFTPLLVGLLGLDIGGRERESHIDRLICIQAGTIRDWLIARMIAVTIITGTATTTLCLAAGITGSAPLGQIAGLVILALAYTVLWAGILMAVNAHAKTVRGAAFAFGAVWTVLCVLLPSIAAEFALGHVQTDYARDETLRARALQYEAYEKELPSVLPSFYERYPALQRTPAATAEELDPLVGRHVYDLLVVDAMADRHVSRLSEESDARDTAEAAVWGSPAIALTLALERLAGAGPDATSAYRKHLVDSVRSRAMWVTERAFLQEPLTIDDFDTLVSSAPPPFEVRREGLAGPALALGIWVLACWFYAVAKLARQERLILAT